MLGKKNNIAQHSFAEKDKVHTNNERQRKCALNRERQEIQKEENMAAELRILVPHNSFRIKQVRQTQFTSLSYE